MYIRTKDCVYEVKVNKYHELVYCKNNQIVLSCNILNQSENLEELCDEGVIEVKFGSTGYKAHFNKYIDELKNFLKYLKECQPITKDEILNVYGAIWTDEGLIYVAKMNDKGELVLI